MLMQFTATLQHSDRSSHQCRNLWGASLQTGTAQVAPTCAIILKHASCSLLGGSLRSSTPARPSKAPRHPLLTLCAAAAAPLCPAVAPPVSAGSRVCQAVGLWQQSDGQPGVSCLSGLAGPCAWPGQCASPETEITWVRGVTLSPKHVLVNV